MYDTVLGATPEPKPAPVFEPVVAAEPEVEPIFATELEPEAEAELIPAPEIESEMPAAFFEPEPAHEELAPVAIAQEMPPVSPAAVEVDSIAAVALAAEEEVPEMTVHENQGTIQGQASPVGSTAPAIDDRPALRVETNPIIDVKDPLEKIEGIGQVYQTKLYEAGIKTFAQLAAASPSRITEVVEPQNWQTIDIMKWRREAALYAAGEKS